MIDKRYIITGKDRKVRQESNPSFNKRCTNIVHIEAAVDDLPLRDGHPVVVHLLQVELLVGEEGLRGLAQHQLQLTKGSPPEARG